MNLKHMRNRPARTTAALVALTLALALAWVPPAHAADRTYTFTSFTYSRFGDADRLDMLQTLNAFAKDASEKTGIKIKYVQYGSDGYLTGFKKGEVDFGLVSMDDVFTLKRMGVTLEPLVTVSMKKKNGMRGCIYTKKDIKNVKDLAGAPVNLYGAGSYRGGYVLIRKLLLDNGIDMPPYEFFGPIYKIPYEGSGFQALLLGKIDAVADADWNFEVFGKNLPQSKSIKTVYCTDMYPVMGVFMKKGTDKAVAAKLRKYLKGMSTSPALGELRTILLALNVKFVDPDLKLLDNAMKVFEQAQKKGWFDEAEAFGKKMDKLEYGDKLAPQKKTYKQCKALCQGDSGKEACLDRCMGE